jgi:hypothetical protein
VTSVLRVFLVLISIKKIVLSLVMCRTFLCSRSIFYFCSRRSWRWFRSVFALAVGLSRAPIFLSLRDLGFGLSLGLFSCGSLSRPLLCLCANRISPRFGSSSPMSWFSSSVFSTILLADRSSRSARSVLCLRSCSLPPAIFPSAL